MPRKIVDIDVEEITICDSTANRKQFFIKKTRRTMDKFIELIKGFVVDEDDDELTKEEIAKAEALGKEPKAVIENALNTFGEYKENMPDDLLAAAKILVKQASFVDPIKKEELEKAGAALSKTTKAQLTKILAHLKGGSSAIATLKALLGEKVEKEDVVDDDGEKLSAETEAKLEKLQVLEKAETERIEKEEKEKKEKEDEDAQEIKDRLKALETGKPVKKSLDDEGDDDDDDDKKKKKKGLKKDEDEEDLWPSLYVPGLTE
jgi:hypothetical protein